MSRARQIGVIGPGTDVPERWLSAAEEVGRLLAEAGVTLICGGLMGVMEAACRGAWSARGQTIGLLPGSDPNEGNEFLSVRIPTGLGQGRNVVLVKSCAAVICIGGSWGTLSEVAAAGREEVPVSAFEAWQVTDSARVPIPDQPVNALTPAEAVRVALQAASDNERWVLLSAS